MASTETAPKRRLIDPRNAYPRPPFPKQAQSLPGTVAEMQPRPDHGEKSYRGSGRLTGLATLITGGDSGIGKAAAIAFAREGADVVISYLSENEDAQDTVRLIEAEGRRAIAVPGDLSDEAQAKQLAQRAKDELGRVDVLVNNAAFQQRFESIGEIPTEIWDRTMRTNLSAMFWLCREIVPGMEPGASVINTASIQARDPSSSLLAYATTKGGIVAFSQALASEVAQKGIRVNVVAPGPVWTPLIPASTDPEGTSKFGAQSPLGRPAQPAELAPAFVFLASTDASYITGEVLAVTGGEFFS